MGYTVVKITLNDGRAYQQAVIDSGYVARVRGCRDVPFTEAEINAIEPTHQKWRWDDSSGP
jgi:hypothetical protein